MPRSGGYRPVRKRRKTAPRSWTRWPQEFNAGGHIPFRIVLYPVSLQEGERISQSVLQDVARGVRWHPEDNCQDLATRAVTGHNGSPTRDAIVGAGLFGALLWLLAS